MDAVTQTRLDFYVKCEVAWGGKHQARNSPQHEGYWAELIDNLPANKVDYLIYRVRKVKPSGYIPTLPMFWAIWREIQGEEQVRYSIPADQCSACVDGLIVVPAVQIEGKWVIGDPEAGILNAWGFPCVCSRGAKYRSHENKEPAKAALEFWKRTVEKLPEGPQNCSSLAEARQWLNDLKRRYDGPVSYPDVVRNLCVESIKIHAPGSLGPAPKPVRGLVCGGIANDMPEAVGTLLDDAIPF